MSAPTCTITLSGTVCIATCTSGARFDLSGRAATPMWHAVDQLTADQHDYYFAACGPLHGTQCTGSAVSETPAIQTWGSPSPQPPAFPADSCASLGAFNTRACHSHGGALLTCEYANGDADRAVSISFRCAHYAQPPTVVQRDQSLHYEIEFIGPEGCATGTALLPLSNHGQ